MNKALHALTLKYLRKISLQLPAVTSKSNIISHCVIQTLKSFRWCIKKKDTQS